MKDLKPKICAKSIVDMVTAGKLGLKSGEGFYDYTEGLENKKVAVQFTNNSLLFYLKKESTKLMFTTIVAHEVCVLLVCLL